MRKWELYASKASIWGGIGFAAWLDGAGTEPQLLFGLVPQELTSNWNVTGDFSKTRFRFILRILLKTVIEMYPAEATVRPRM